MLDFGGISDQYVSTVIDTVASSASGQFVFAAVAVAWIDVQRRVLPQAAGEYLDSWVLFCALLYRR